MGSFWSLWRQEGKLRRGAIPSPIFIQTHPQLLCGRNLGFDQLGARFLNWETGLPVPPRDWELWASRLQRTLANCRWRARLSPWAATERGTLKDENKSNCH